MTPDHKFSHTHVQGLCALWTLNNRIRSCFCSQKLCMSFLTMFYFPNFVFCDRYACTTFVAMPSNASSVVEILNFLCHTTSHTSKHIILQIASLRYRDLFYVIILLLRTFETSGIFILKNVLGFLRTVTP